MKRHLRTAPFAVFLVILFATAALESDQAEEVLEVGDPGKNRLHEKTPFYGIYLERTTRRIDGNSTDSSGKTNVSLCCPVGNFLSGVDCVEATMNRTKVWLLAIYTDAPIPTIVNENKDVQFVIWKPCAGAKRYSLNPNAWHDLLSNGSVLRPTTEMSNDHYSNYVRYCQPRPIFPNYDGNPNYPPNYFVFFCEEEYTIEDNGGVIVIYSYGMLASVPFLVATYVVYWLLPDLRNLHGLTLRGYVGCLALAYSMLGVLRLTEEQIPKGICITFAFIVYFSFLASFFWLNVMCFDIWWTFGGFRSLQGSVKQREKKKFVMYSIYAWGSASILTVICVIMNFVPSVPKELIRPEIGETKCWFNTNEARALYFYLPMSVTIVCNICLFISTALKIVRQRQDTAVHLRSSESRRHDDNKQWFNLYLKLFIVMGINWSMEIISWLFEKSSPAYVWYLSDLTNILQGLIIFIIFVWKEKIKRLLLKRFSCQDCGLFSRNSTRSGCHSSASRHLHYHVGNDVAAGEGQSLRANKLSHEEFDEAD